MCHDIILMVYEYSHGMCITNVANAVKTEASAMQLSQAWQHTCI